MYAIIDDNKVVIGLEYRGLPLEELVHRDYHKNYIETNENIKVGDIYHSETKTFEITKTPEPSPPSPEELPKPTQQDRIEANLDFLVMINS